MAYPSFSLADSYRDQNNNYTSQYADGMNFNIAGNQQPANNGMPEFGMPKEDSLANRLGGYADVALAGTGLLNTYLGFKDAKMQKRQMGASLAFQNQANANAAVTTNDQLRVKAEMAAQGYGHQPGTEGFNKYVADNQVQVDGSAVRM
jgi:hypothetical protein